MLLIFGVWALAALAYFSWAAWGMADRDKRGVWAKGDTIFGAIVFGFLVTFAVGVVVVAIDIAAEN